LKRLCSLLVSHFGEKRDSSSSAQHSFRRAYMEVSGRVLTFC